MIKEDFMGLKKKVTTKDIADHVGLSQSAVSMILNNKTNVSFSDSTRQKVLDAAKDLAIKKRKSIEQTSKPLSKIILIMCPFLSKPLLYNSGSFDHRTSYMIMDILPLLHQHCETRAPNNIIWIL